MLEPSRPELQGLQTADLGRQVSSKPKDIEPLTPNHLMLLRAHPSLRIGSFGKEDSNGKHRW